MRWDGNIRVEVGHKLEEEWGKMTLLTKYQHNHVMSEFQRTCRYFQVPTTAVSSTPTMTVPPNNDKKMAWDATSSWSAVLVFYTSFTLFFFVLTWTCLDNKLDYTYHTMGQRRSMAATTTWPRPSPPAWATTTGSGRMATTPLAGRPYIDAFTTTSSRTPLPTFRFPYYLHFLLVKFM